MSGRPLAHTVGVQVASAIASLLLVLGVTFALFEALPSDAARATLGLRQREADVEALRRSLGLDRPWPARFCAYVGQVAQGDLGRSLVTGEAVGQAIALRARRSAVIVGLSFALSSAVTALLLALAATMRERSRRTLELALGAVAAIPALAVGALLVLVATALRLSLLPAGPEPTGAELLVPALVLAPYPVALQFRAIQRSLEATRNAPPMVAALALGIPRSTIVVSYALRAAMAESLAIVSNLAGFYISALFAVEAMFSVGGVGWWSVVSAQRYDYPVVSGTTVLFCSVYVGVGVLSRLLLVWIDPRGGGA
jgi:peptide/nickel transport system permease protein